MYAEQTFTTIEVLEPCLKQYAKKMGFEIRTVRCPTHKNQRLNLVFLLEFSPVLHKIPGNIMEEIEFYATV